MIYSITTLIIDTIATLIAALLLLRFWMQAVRVHPPISISQFMFRLTDWVVLPIRGIFPGLGGYDWASLIAAFLVAMLSIGLKLFTASAFSWDALFILAILKIIHWIMYGFTFLILIEVVFSWINPHAPFAPVVRMLNLPLMRPLRKFIPLIGGIDLSPIAAFILLKIIITISDNFVKGIFPIKFWYV